VQILKRIRRHSWSIQAQFLIYSLALLVPVLIFSGLMFVRSAALERKSMQREINDVARSASIAIDRELAAAATTLKALASSPSLAEGDLKAFYGQAKAAQEVGTTHFFLTDAKGRQRVNTRTAWGDPLPEKSANDWEEVIRTGKPSVSNLYQGIMARGPAFSISVPVKRGKRTIYVLSASITPDRIYDILQNENLDEGWIATVIDRSGVVIASSQAGDNSVGRQLRPDIWEGSKQHYGVWRTTDDDGVPVLRASTHALQSGWLVSVTVPVAIANQPMVRSWTLVAVLGLSFVLLSALLAYLFGRRFSDPVRQLVEGARALGRAELVHPVDTSILEVRAVGDALARASQTRRRMEKSLREGEDRLRLALASADTGVWDWDLKTGALTWDKRMHELWALEPDSPVTVEAFLSALHAQDRARTLAAIETAKDPDNPLEYDVEHRVIGGEDGVERWIAAQGRAYFADGVAVRMTGTARDITERKHWEQHTQLLMREITHRSKNLLAVIQAMARQTKVGSKSIADFEARFSGRLQALAASHDLLVQRDWHGVPVADLIKSQLGHYLDDHATQIDISGQKMIVTPEAAQNIGLAVHELSTNAAKYGALSVPEGKVTVHWKCTRNGTEESRFHIAWNELHGPNVEAPKHKGFGQVVLEQLAARALQGEATLQFSKDGVCWSLDIPASHILWQERAKSG
jgi:PAS domain S-box-containing protein